MSQKNVFALLDLVQQSRQYFEEEVLYSHKINTPHDSVEWITNLAERADRTEGFYWNTPLSAGSQMTGPHFFMELSKRRSLQN